MTSLEDVVARVRGLSSRLLGRPVLARLARSTDLHALVNEWAGTAYATVPDDAVNDAARLDRTTRRVAAQQLVVIADWCGPRVSLLAPLFEDEDRRNLRALTRGVVAGTPIEQRTAGLLPSPSLPLPLLDELSRQARLRDIAALLSLWGNPYGPVMMTEALRVHPDLFLMQLALDKEYFERARDTADRAGSEIRWYVRILIDAENLASALATAARSVERKGHDLFIEGGSVTRAEYDRLRASEPADARARLERIVAATPLAPLAARNRDVESALLAATIKTVRRTIRVAPLSIGVVLDYVLRLRAEIHDLACIVWGIALDVPRRRIDAGLVTP